MSGTTEWTTGELRARATRHRAFRMHGGVLFDSHEEHREDLRRQFAALTTRLKDVAVGDPAWRALEIEEFKAAKLQFEGDKLIDAEYLLAAIARKLDHFERDLAELRDSVPRMEADLRQDAQRSGRILSDATEAWITNARQALQDGNLTQAKIFSRRMNHDLMARRSSQEIEAMTATYDRTLQTPALGIVDDAQRFTPEGAAGAYKKANKQYQAVIQAMGQLVDLTSQESPDEKAVFQQVQEVIVKASDHQQWLQQKHPNNLRKEKKPYIDELKECAKLISMAREQLTALNRIRKARLDALNQLKESSAAESFDMLVALQDSPVADIRNFARINLTEKAKIVLEAAAEANASVALQKVAHTMDPADPRQAAVLIGAIGSCAQPADRDAVLEHLTGQDTETAQRKKLAEMIADSPEAGVEMFSGQIPGADIYALFEDAERKSLEPMAEAFAEAAVTDPGYMVAALRDMLQNYQVGGGTQPLRAADPPVAPLKMCALLGGGQQALDRALGPTLEQIGRQAELEIDPMVVTDREQLAANCETVRQFVRQIMAQLWSMEIPMGVAKTCLVIHDRYIAEGQARVRALVGGHIFLRIVSPMVVKAGGRAAIYVSKVLQSISNHQPPKDPNMQALTGFITDSMAEFDQYLDALVLSNQPIPDIATVLARGNAITILRQYFGRQHATENLDFYQAITPNAPVGHVADDVYTRFLAVDAPEPVNLAHSSVQPAHDIYQQPVTERDWTALDWDGLRAEIRDVMDAQYAQGMYAISKYPELLAQMRLATR